MVGSVPRILEGRGRLVQNASVAATELIRQAILDGRLEPGSRLKEEELARELGISRTPVREALLMLQAEGLIETTPNRGRRRPHTRCRRPDRPLPAARAARRLCGPPGRDANLGARPRADARELRPLRQDRGRRHPRARQGKPLVPLRDPPRGRKRAPERDGTPGDRAAPRLQVVRVVLAGPETDLGALPPADHERAQRARRRTGGARHARAHLRGPRSPGRERPRPSARIRSTTRLREPAERSSGGSGGRGANGRPARRRPCDRAGHAARRTVHGAAARGSRRGDHQGRGSDQAGSDP